MRSPNLMKMMTPHIVSQAVMYASNVPSRRDERPKLARWSRRGGLVMGGGTSSAEVRGSVVRSAAWLRRHIASNEESLSCMREYRVDSVEYRDHVSDGTMTSTAGIDLAKLRECRSSKAPRGDGKPGSVCFASLESSLVSLESSLVSLRGGAALAAETRRDPAHHVGVQPVAASVLIPVELEARLPC